MGNRSISTIPSGVSFLDTLAVGLLKRTAEHPLSLAQMTVFLPTRRGCIELKKAFLRHNPTDALLLPRMIPLGEIDSEEEFIHLPGNTDPLNVIPNFTRLGLLCQLILTYTQNSGTAPHSMESALQLSKMLITLMDQATIEEISWERLTDLVPEEFASHWQITLDFLTIVKDHWPKIITQSGYVEPHVARALTIDHMIQRFTASPPPHPIIIAGSTGTMPATARLMDCVSRLPQGEIILPGLDQTLDDDHLTATHPQYSSLQLLKKLNVSPQDVPTWSHSPQQYPSSRALLFRDSLKPESQPTQDPKSLENLFLIETKTRAQEALSIAVLLRETLEHPTKTAALITPDRKLARQVALELKRWGITIDDSAGEPLNTTPTGTFLRLILNVCASKDDVASLLALLKHPFLRLGHTSGVIRTHTRRLEIHHLRGLKKSWNHLATCVTPDSPLAPVFDSLNTLTHASSLSHFVEQHLEIAETFSTTHESSMPLWSGPRGQKFQEFFKNILESVDAFPTITTVSDYQALFDILLQGLVSRPHHEGHPRLKILGPIEARLYQADRVILGGLNEGSWPPEISSDPWLSRPMRETMGFPPADRRMGLSAHDFGQAFASPEVFLTRSLRSDGAPTIASRWLSALEVHLKKSGQSIPSCDHIGLWTRALDHPQTTTPCPAPEPRPPVSTRPRHLPVTAIETWMRDPYALYAKYILNLKPLDPIGRPLTPADRGTLIHHIFEHFTKEHKQTLDDLLAIGREAFAPFMDDVHVQFFWWPKFCREAEWFMDHLPTEYTHSEVKGSMTVPSQIPFTLTAKADRIECHPDGALRIIDYKTGQPPTLEDTRQGLSPQLPLEGAIGRYGQFDDVPGHGLEALEFWHIKGHKSTILSLKGDLDTLTQDAYEGLTELINTFDDPDVPYLASPRSQAALRYNDYLHLSRYNEWKNTASGDGV